MDALYQKIVNRNYLNDDDYQELFQRPDAQQLAELAVMSWMDFPGYEEKLLTLPHSEVIIRYLILSRMGTPELLDKTFDFPNAEEHILSFAFVENQHCDFEAFFTQDVIARVFRLSNASEIIKICILNVKEFSFENEAKLFDLPDAEDIITQFILIGNELEKEEEVKLFSLPHPAKIITYYILAKNSFWEDNDLLLFDLPEAKELVALCSQYSYLNDKAKQKALELGWI